MPTSATVQPAASPASGVGVPKDPVCPNRTTGTRIIGLSALVFSTLYLLSDVIEAIQGGFSASQLWITLVAEAAIPVFVVGLYIVQRPQIGRLGLISALAYAYSYVFFTGTVVYALVDATPDYKALTNHLGASMTIHGAIMLLAGLASAARSSGLGCCPAGRRSRSWPVLSLSRFHRACSKARRWWPPRSAILGSSAWALRCCGPVAFRAMGSLARGDIRDRQANSHRRGS
jgi:hypothetical protein